MTDNDNVNYNNEEEITIGAGIPKTQAIPKRSNKIDETVKDKIDQKRTANDLLDEILNKSDEEFLPWEDITLPSGGVYYEDKIPNGVVQVRPMNIQAEKILATQRLIQTGQAIDKLYEHCVNLPEGFEPQDLLAGDRVFLLYYIRGITHGNIYEFNIKCPSCSNNFISSYDLNDLAATITPASANIGEEPFKIDLPYMSEILGYKIWVFVKFPRGRDLAAISDRIRFNKRITTSSRNVGDKAPKHKVAIDESISDNLNVVIQSFGGEGVEGKCSDKGKLAAFINKLHSKDTSVIREFLDKYMPGIQTQIQVECPDCGHEFRSPLPITETFFRPSST